MKKEYDLLKVVSSALDCLPTDSKASKEVYQYCKDNGIVVCFGGSDDLMELRGAIDDEYGCYEGGAICIDEHGTETDAKDYHPIIAYWCKDEDGFAWTYELDAPHEEFCIYDDGDPYCRGIVFFAEDLKKKPAHLTNGGWLRELSDEEFAKVFGKDRCEHCANLVGDKKCSSGGTEACEAGVLAWLRAERKE